MFAGRAGSYTAATTATAKQSRGLDGISALQLQMVVKKRRGFQMSVSDGRTPVDVIDLARRQRDVAPIPRVSPFWSVSPATPSRARILARLETVDPVPFRLLVNAPSAAS